MCIIHLKQNTSNHNSTFYLIESIANLIVGEGASHSNTITNDMPCFPFGESEDNVKEGLEAVILTLNTSDSSVCIGRDFTIVNIPPNGGC